jgi:hypothetical protein
VRLGTNLLPGPVRELQLAWAKAGIIRLNLRQKNDRKSLVCDFSSDGAHFSACKPGAQPLDTASPTRRGAAAGRTVGAEARVARKFWEAMAWTSP